MDEGGGGGEDGDANDVESVGENDGNFRSGPRKGAVAAGGGAAEGSWRTVKPKRTQKRRIQRTEFKPSAENDYDRKFIEIRKLLNKLTRINVDDITKNVQAEFDGLDETHQMKVFQCIHENAAKQAIFIEQ